MFKVLHVEHNRFYHVVLKNLISADNVQYIPAKSPKEATDILNGTKVDLVVTGLVFEEEQGYEFVETLMTGKYDNLPVIVLSSNDDDMVKNKLLGMGVTEYVNKNTSINRVKWHVDRLNNKQHTNESLRKAKIAVLDDNELELKLLEGIFEANKVENVEYFSDPVDFLLRVEDFEINIIDFALPKISAEYICSKIKKQNKKCIILALAAVSDERDVVNILSSGADDYIMKPLHEKVVYDRLNYALTGNAARMEEQQATKHVPDKTGLDFMTQTYNRAYLTSFMELMMEKYRYGGDLAIVVFNIDGVRHMNNVFGLDFGDQVIIKVGEIMKELIRSTDVLGRYGGEEFMLILPDTEIQGAATIAEKIRHRIQQSDFGKKNLQVTVSAGVSEIDSDSSERLVEKAYSMMRRAKRTGRNRVEYELLV